MVVGFAIYAVVMMGMCGILASSKNRDVFGWSALGLFFGIFAFFLLWALPAGQNARVESMAELSSKLDKRAIIFAAVLFLFIFLITEYG